MNLDELRYRKYSTKIVTNKGAIKPEDLGPTSDAASYHSLRAYYQVQIWIGNNSIDPLQWGFRIKNNMLPIPMSKPPAPSELWKVIRCGGKTDCQ